MCGEEIACTLTWQKILPKVSPRKVRYVLFAAKFRHQTNEASFCDSSSVYLALQ